MEFLFIIYTEFFFCKTSKNLRCQEVFRIEVVSCHEDKQF